MKVNDKILHFFSGFYHESLIKKRNEDDKEPAYRKIENDFVEI